METRNRLEERLEKWGYEVFRDFYFWIDNYEHFAGMVGYRIDGFRAYAFEFVDDYSNIKEYMEAMHGLWLDYLFLRETGLYDRIGLFIVVGGSVRYVGIGELESFFG